MVSLAWSNQQLSFAPLLLSLLLLAIAQAAFRKLQYWQFFETVALHGLRPLIPHGMPADYQMLMEHCWQADPSNRPNASRWASGQLI